MEFDNEIIFELFASDDSEGLVSVLSNVLEEKIQSKKDWDDLVMVLQEGCLETYQKHWLKTHSVILSLFSLSELLGADCSLFKELLSLQKPDNIKHASDSFFLILVELTRNQFRNGGSTLFFNVNELSSTRSAIVVSDLVQARYRETIFTLEEMDMILPTLTKEWVNVSRLWRTGNGYRILLARNLGTIIHIKDYKEIRKLLLKELNIDSEMITVEADRLRDEGVSNYLELSKTLDDFVTGLIASHGIRGAFEPHYRDWINHEGLDEF